MRLFYRLAILTLFINITAVDAADMQNPFLGTWRTEVKKDSEEEDRWAEVEITACDRDQAKLCGKIVNLQEPIDPETGAPKLDKHNENADLRDRPLMGLEILSDFSKDSDTKYSYGSIYSPRKGKTYSSDMEINPENSDELFVVGKILFFSKTQTWTRVK